MDIAALIQHPENLDRETLYDLRSLLALYPYYQTARLLLLQNLYLLHDPTFNEELKRAAIYITDRKVVFNLVEAAHYRFKLSSSNDETAAQPTTDRKDGKRSDRTISLIDTFLDSIPEEKPAETKSKRRPTPADAAIDYVSYLMETDSEEKAEEKPITPLLKGQDLIDNFINIEGKKIKLKEEPEYVPTLEIADEEEAKEVSESYFTETLAKIYIKQARYDKALEIIQRINLNNPKKNAYFADQIRFLEKLILNNKIK
ncbi:MAG: tetratricopeptide repeat protein [Prevotella sp.]|nr:tetratricopeptide repeat protein [Prevotella sp.]